MANFGFARFMCYYAYMKPKYSILLAILFVGILWQGGNSAIGKTKQELETSIKGKQEEIKRLEAEAKRFKEEATKKGKEAASLKQEITLIDTKIRQLNNDIRRITKEIEKTDLEIQLINDEISNLEETMEKRRKSLGAAVQALYETSDQNILEIALKYDSLSDIFSNIESITSVEQSLKESINGIRELKNTKEQAEKIASLKKDDLVGFKTSLNLAKITSQNEEKDKKQILTATKSTESLYQKMTKEAEAQKIAILRELEQLEEELRKTIDPSHLPKSGTGVLGWPVELAKAVVAQGYGRTSFAKKSHYYEFHNGIDICIKGNNKQCDDELSLISPVLAAEDGEVIGTGNSDQFCWRGALGRWVSIKHTNGLATTYAHLSAFSVSQGDKVKRGQTIGTMGNSGLSTGPHVHFTVYAADTLTIRPSRVCGLLPIGGSLNPMEYL